MIQISTKGQILFFKDNETVRFEAKGNHTIIYSFDGTSSEIDEPMDSIARQLKNYAFIRIGKNHLINVNFITGIPDKASDFIEVNNSQLLPISKEQKEIIIQLISSHLKN
jgi:DNA-binding LytR/AlgR family response regulator